MFYLRNLSSQELLRGLPWEFKPSGALPEEVRGDKEARDRWINRPSTDWCVYTLIEGVNPNIRISKPRNDGGGNPPHCAHGLAADYDAPMDQDSVLKLARALPYPPNWIERTLSGHWRYIWLFEEPLIFPSYDFAKHFFTIFAEFAFDPSRGGPAFDSGAWKAPERLYTNSGDWIPLQGDKIPAEVARGWLVKASGKFKFTDREFGSVIPLDAVKPELAKTYPRFAGWPGEFVVGAQGPTFWIDGSLSPKSAIVRETGIQTFSAHSPKGFYTWADLLGVNFVKGYEAEAVGRAVEDIYYDGKNYWRKGFAGIYQPSDKTELALHLKVSRGVNGKPDKSGISEVERALEHIHNAQRVEGAGPYVAQPPGLIHRHGRPYLNWCSIKALPPAEGTATWGPQGFFPTLSTYFDGIVTPDQREYLLAWIKFAYESLYHYQPHSGQVLFVAGPPDVGKTLLSRGILGKLFGGFAEATRVYLGEDSFNADVLRFFLNVVDDTDATSSPEKMRKWTAALKRVAANPSVRCNEKFRTATLVEWLGRLIVTLNADEVSVLILPDTSASILDKLIILRTNTKPPLVYPRLAEMNRILDRELPHFARWLLDWTVPEELHGTSRFGLKPFAEATLLETARQSSQAASFAEILDDFRREFFQVREPKAEVWEGTAYQLHREISIDPGATAAMKSYTVEAVGRQLSALKNRGVKLETFSDSGGLRRWRIFRDEKTPATKPKL